MHIFHKWEVVYRYEVPTKKAWFEHLKCKTCGREILDYGWTFFTSSYSDVFILGWERGIYRAAHPQLKR